MAINAGTVQALTAADLGGFKSDMRKMRREGNIASKDVERDFGRMGRNLGNIAKGVGLAFGAAFVAVGGMALKEAANIEALRVQIDTLVGSAREGERVFQRLQDYSAGTPFQLDDLVKANNILIGMGQSSDEAFTNLEMLGDIASATGANINELAVTFGQASAEGKLMTRDIREFINRGVPLTKLLAESMGVAKSEIFDLAEQGKISYGVLVKAIQQATSQTGIYADATEKAADTDKGAKSTMTDNARMLLGAVGRLVSETLDLKGIMQDSAGVLKTAKDRVEELEISTGNLKDEFNGLKFIVTGTSDAMQWLLGDFEDFVWWSMQIEKHMPTGLFRNAVGGIRDFLRWVGRASEGTKDLNEDVKALNSGTEWTMVSHIEGAETATTNTVQATKNWSTELDRIREQLNTMPTPEIYDPIFDGASIEPMQRLNDIVQEMGSYDFSHRLSEEMDEITEKSHEASGAATFFSHTLADGLESVLFQARSVEDAIKGIIRQLASRALTTGLLGLFGGGFGSAGFFGSMFGGFRASGGSVSSGKSYIVGEKGPEMFVPNTSGSIVPNGAMGGRQVIEVHVNGTFTQRGIDLEAVIREVQRQQGRLN